MSAIVRLSGISKSYQSVPVLENIRLELFPGKFYALVGRNGVGKSTLMRIIVRQELADSGSGAVAGYSLDSESPEVRRELAYVSESIDYAIPQSIDEISRIYAASFPRWDGAGYLALLRRFGLDPSKRYAQLSRGQRMQVAFALAYSCKPKLLLLDEITAVLDAGARDLVIELLKGFVQAGGTVLLATNIVTEVPPDAVFLMMPGLAPATSAQALAAFAEGTKR